MLTHETGKRFHGFCGDARPSYNIGEDTMIKLTKLNKNNDETFILNCELIETIEERPDTTIRLVNGKHFVVAESSAEVVSKVVAFKRSIYGR